MAENNIVWEVFIQSKNGLAHKHVGNVHAADKIIALENARELYTRRNEGSCIWVVKSSEIVSSESEDSEAFLIHQMIKYTVIPLSIQCLKGLNIYKFEKSFKLYFKNR